MDIRQLRCFDAVLRTGAMTKAADLLGLAQPTVSVTIATLEREIGFSLFKRSKGSLEPTPEAYLFHQSAIQAIESISDVARTATQIKRLNVGEVSILSNPGAAWALLPALISEFHQAHRSTQFKLISRSSESLRKLTLARNFDMAVVEAPVQFPSDDVKIINYRCKCAVPIDHRLARKKVITPKDIGNEPFAILFAEHATHHQIRKAFSDDGVELNIALECEFFATACSFVRQQGGITIIDPLAAIQFPQEELVLVPFKPRIEYQLALIRPTERASSRLAEQFYSLLRKRLYSLR